MATDFDYVIVGSGPAGSVLANRLSEDGISTVCVLEAGPLDKHPYIRIPAAFVKLLNRPDIMWPFECEPGAAIAGRSVRLPQGRVVGGSSSINGLAYTRGQAEDFDDWAALGNAGWGYRDVLPYFMKSERRIGIGDPVYRGLDGELPVTDPDWTSPLCEAFIAGAAELGIPRNPDYNGAQQLGAGYFQRTIDRGRRVSAADAFLHPAVQRGRVDLRTDAVATAIVFDGRRATGVSYQQGAEKHIVRARREVILCAGTINSPKLLQLSGIGPGPLLQQLGVPVLQHLPGVGENLRDHYTVRMTARARDVRTINESAHGWRLGIEIAKWLAGRPSIIGLSPSLVHVFWKTRAELTRGDIQVLFTPASYKPGKHYQVDDAPGMSVGARQQRPESRGSVRIASADPLAAPRVQPNYLHEEQDQRTIVAALKIARRLLRSRALQPFFDAETLPGDAVASDDEWLDFARRIGNTAYHLVGSCSMGPGGDPLAVVDAQLRVRGVDGLRVVDASVIPRVPSANTLAATLMVGERAADLIRGVSAPATALAPDRAAPVAA
ncbi:GMC family oxidoreductase [Piscinibacter sakaiensis]|uniref:GMC family oxidoreductase n=1 Tax=Piscinibacter sakaiensis TaxID=1547922 RepID=UPI003AAFC3B5